MSIPTGYPYFRWWLREAEADEFYRTASDAELGFYHRCLNRSWDSGGLPVDPAKRAILLGKTRAYADKMWKTVGTKFVPSETDPSRLVNNKQESEREYVRLMSERNARAGHLKNKRKANGLPHEYGSGSDSGSVASKTKIQEVAALWSDAGFDGPDHFEDWWLQVVANHPNKNRNANAKMHIFELIVTGQFIRSDFESGYSELRESKADDWEKEGGKYCTNLFDIVQNRLWKFKPTDAVPSWVSELEQEQNQ